MAKNVYDQLAQLWIKRAKDDILWARDSLKSRHYSGVCFLSQQIAEKSLKAYLFSKKEKLVKTHDLDFLFKKCVKHDKEFLKIASSGAKLSEYYITSRYPDLEKTDALNDESLAKEALALAKKIWLFASRKI